jgi:Uma2 family endonuclease
MSASIVDTATDSGIPPYPVRRFSVAEYEELARLGILDEDDNVELLEGWIVPKITKHPPHDNTIDVLQYLLMRMLPLGWYVRVQNSVVTADSVPEPDLAVVRGEPGIYGDKHPRGPDVSLIIEVADSTVLRDRAKAAIYARAGIPHYWIVNLDDRQIEVFGQPKGKGAERVYSSREVLPGDASLPVVIEGSEIGVLAADKILPSR